MFLELQPAVTNVGKIVKTYFDRIRFPKKKKKMCVVCYENKRPVKDKLQAQPMCLLFE
jgi:hypothetical protein